MLAKRAGAKEHIITVSDKGNDLVITTVNIYEEQAKEQTGKDQVIPRD